MAGKSAPAGRARRACRQRIFAALLLPPPSARCLQGKRGGSSLPAAASGNMAAVPCGQGRLGAPRGCVRPARCCRPICTRGARRDSPQVDRRFSLARAANAPRKASPRRRQGAIRGAPQRTRERLAAAGRSEACAPAACCGHLRPASSSKRRRVARPSRPNSSVCSGTDHRAGTLLRRVLMLHTLCVAACGSGVAWRALCASLPVPERWAGNKRRECQLQTGRCPRRCGAATVCGAPRRGRHQICTPLRCAWFTAGPAARRTPLPQRPRWAATWTARVAAPATCARLPAPGLRLGVLRAVRGSPPPSPPRFCPRQG